ncbi:MAG: TerD family protein [Clostridia bacterium]|nr:TerD family protein [Clostridia bacterium]
MAISLRKGERVDVTKSAPGLSKLVVGLGWDTNGYYGGNDFDLDAQAFLLNATGRVNVDEDLVFYGNTTHPSGAVMHTGDNRTGEGDGDDEQILVDLSMVPGNISRIDFTATIYDGEERGQNFGQVSNAYIRIVDATTGNELIRYDLGEDFSIETAVVVGSLYRHNGEWKFSAVGSGFQSGLETLCGYYGIEL